MKEIYDVVIVGGGPAGVTAGIYTARQKLKTLLITKEFGGQMAKKAVAIENYPGFEEISGLGLMEKFEKHLKKKKIDIKIDTVRKIRKNKSSFSVLTSSKKEFQARAIILASGADPRPLEIPGEKEFIGRGVSYCVTCDGPLYAGKEVAVIGGGNSAFEAAAALSTYAKKIYILERSSQIRADEENQARVRRIKKVDVLTNVILQRIEGKDFVEKIVYQDSKSKETKTLKVDGIFVEIGTQPATSFVKGLVEFNKVDEILVNPKTGQTTTPGLFAAGDADDVPYKQIVIAAGEGAKAAMAVSEYLQKL